MSGKTSKYIFLKEEDKIKFESPTKNLKLINHKFNRISKL